MISLKFILLFLEFNFISIKFYYMFFLLNILIIFDSIYYNSDEFL